MEKIQETLKYIRSESRLSQSQFAEKIGMKQSAYSMLESGVNKPTYDVLSKIVSIFNVPSSVFFERQNDIVTDGNKTTENGYLNGSENGYLNDKNRVKSSDLSQKNTEYLKGKTWFSDKVFEEAVSSAYSIDQLSAKTKKLRDMQASYYNKVNRELDKSHENLYKIMRLAENVDALADLIWTAISAYINARPNPFDAFQYLDLQNKTEHIPDTIDYKEYKQDVINWLETIEKYQDIIKEFYNHGEHFLKQIKPLDTDGIID